MEDAGRPGPGGKPEWALTKAEVMAAWRARVGLPPRRRRWPWVVLLLVLLAGGGAAWWRAGQAPPPAEPAPAAAEAAPPTLQLGPAEVTTLAPLTLRRTVKVIGTLSPARRADLAAETAGQVEEVLVRPGDAVAQGDVLLRLDEERLGLDRDLARSNADATRAQLRLAEGQLARARELLERGAGTTSAVEQAESAAEGLRASLAALDDQVRAAELGLERATLRAPFAGVVASRAVEPGAVVGAGTALLSLVDLARMEMQASAPVSAGSALRPGQAVELRVDGVDGPFAGAVARIAPVADEATRRVTVFVAVPNPDGRLLGGMFATGEVVVAERREALALPPDAIRDPEGAPYVLVVSDDALARREVRVGATWGDLVEVEGPAPGDVVVTGLLPGLAPGDRVAVVNP